MIKIQNIRTLNGQTTTIQIPSFENNTIDGNRYLMIPGMLDSHFSLGAYHKKDWTSTLISAIRGGVTGAIDSSSSLDHSIQDLIKKQQTVDQLSNELSIPFQYLMYGKGNMKLIGEIGAEKSLVKGITLFNSAEDLKENEWEALFQMAAWQNLPVVIDLIENQENHFIHHQKTENLLEKAIHYTEKQSARLYVLNTSKENELALIKKGRERSLLIDVETTCAHLFPKDQSFPSFLWEALDVGLINTIGSGYHTNENFEENFLYRDQSFNRTNPIFVFPLLFTAYHQGEISIENIVRLTRSNLYEIFNLETYENDVVLIDMEEERLVQYPYEDRLIEKKLKGWPVYTIIKGQIFTTSKAGHELIKLE